MSLVHSTGIVLCGGRSTRMGTDKAHLFFRGTPLWEHMLRIVSGVREPSPIQHCFLSGSIAGQPCIPDVFPQKGPLGGIYSAICALRRKNLRAQWLVVVPVDMPYLQTESLEHLIAAVSPTTQFAYYEGFLFPLICRVSTGLERRLYQRLTTATTGRTLSVNDLLQTAAAKNGDAVRVIPGRSRASEFLNANTPHEWQRLEDEYPIV